MSSGKSKAKTNKTMENRINLSDWTMAVDISDLLIKVLLFYLFIYSCLGLYLPMILAYPPCKIMLWIEIRLNSMLNEIHCIVKI